jgi:hypothetical protein
MLNRVAKMIYQLILICSRLRRQQSNYPFQSSENTCQARVKILFSTISNFLTVGNEREYFKCFWSLEERKMQAAALQLHGEEQKDTLIAVAGDSGANDSTNCLQIRKKLDAIFDGKLSLEQSFTDIKRFLFGHLEICKSCCRAFDVRARFRSSGRGGIL